jgi:hypothetical protein
MSARPTSLRVLGSSLVANPYAPQFRPYRYNGADKIQAEPVKLKTRADALPCDEPDCGHPSHALRLCLKHYYRYQKAVKKDPSLKRFPVQRGFEPDACGTTRGYERHRYWNHPTCDACQDAKSAYDRARKGRRKEAAA